MKYAQPVAQFRSLYLPSLQVNSKQNNEYFENAFIYVYQGRI